MVEKTAMKGWRTITVNILSTAVPFLMLTEWREVFPEAYLPFWMLFVALMNVWLRMITTTPVGRKG